MAEVIARYWDARGQYTSHPPTTKSQCNHWLDFAGERSVGEVTKHTEQERFKALLAGKGLAEQTINNILSTGRASLRMAYNKGEIPVAPPIKLLPVGEQEPMGAPMDLEEARRLFGEVRDHVWLLHVILLGTMARPGAVLQLDWVQLNFEHDLIYLKKPGMRVTKKRRPVVPMPPFLKAILLPLKKDKGPVIAFEGRAVKTVRTAWRQARKRAKLDPSVTLYSWRHTLGRYLRSKGVAEWEVKGQLGHGKGVTERYAEFDPRFQKDAVAAIEAYWQELWCRQQDSNLRPPDYKSGALPTELCRPGASSEPYPEISATYTITYPAQPGAYKTAALPLS